MFLNFLCVIRIIFRVFELLSFLYFLPLVTSVSLGLGLQRYSSFCHPKHLNLIRAFLIQPLEQIQIFERQLRYQVYQPTKTEPIKANYFIGSQNFKKKSCLVQQIIFFVSLSSYPDSTCFYSPGSLLSTISHLLHLSLSAPNSHSSLEPPNDCFYLIGKISHYFVTPPS